jgi:hypothetical protein
MKRLVLLLFVNLCLFINLLAQNSDIKLNVPKENSRVTKEYDEKGNLIKFDSVYSYSWSGDTTLINSYSPDDIKSFFGDHLGIIEDNTITGNSFFDGFNQFFAQPFSGNQDSLLMKNFGIHQHMHGDSLTMNFTEFGDFFNFLNKDNNDSIPLGKIKPGSQIPDSGEFEDMMKMLHEQMRAMEERHHKIFEEKQNWKEF